MKSRAYKFRGKLFRYDFDNGMVEYIYKADADMRKDNREWMEKWNKPLWEIDEHGYFVADSVGLRRENWKNKENRDHYLGNWVDDMEEEFRCEMAMFEKYELPLYQKGV